MTDERCDFYVYVLFREDGVTPFYVGKGCDRRADWHAAHCLRGGKTIKDRIARKVVKVLGHIPYEKIFTGLTDLQAQSAEAGMIAAMGRRDIGTGILANMTDGGDGGAGHTTSPEVRALRSARTAARMAAPEAKAIAALANRRRFEDPSARAAIANGNRVRWSDPDFRTATGLAISAARSTPEEIARQSEINRVRWAEPGAREAHSDKMRQIQSNPATKAKQSEARRLYWAKRKSAEASVACG